MRAFDIFGRVVGTLLSLLLVCAGVVWTLQAFNLALNAPRIPGGPVSFMVNNRQWALYGAIAVGVTNCEHARHHAADHNIQRTL